VYGSASAAQAAAGGGQVGARVTRSAIDTMRAWLDAIARDTSAAPAREKIKRARPADAVDGCWDASGQRIDEPARFDGAGRCNELYPLHTNPRIQAGAALADDVLKCQLKPIDVKDYAVKFSDAELQRLRQIFTGRCVRLFEAGRHAATARRDVPQAAAGRGRYVTEEFSVRSSFEL
jgi:hypothetical protein